MKHGFCSRFAVRSARVAHRATATILSVKIRVHLWLLLFLILVCPARGGAVDQEVRWNAVRLNPQANIALDTLVRRFQRTEKIYREIQAMRSNGVPAEILFCLLYREADNDMTCSPAQGDPLTHRSRHVPRGRIPGVNPPYTFLQAAEDAYYSPNLDHLDTKRWDLVGFALWNCELFNGPGYAKRGLPSSYIWSGTNQYRRGKFVADGRFDPMAIDKQLGVAAVLKRMAERGIYAAWTDRVD